MNNSLYNNGTGFIPNQMINGYENNTNNYVENYLKEKIGHQIEIHASFCDSIEWRDSIFQGILEQVGKDYIVLNDNNNSYVIWNIYLDYIIIKS